MIEHVSFDGGLKMLQECHRVLRPGGILRIVTPSLGFLLRLISADRSSFEERYYDWSLRTFCSTAEPTAATFVNNFMRAWGHTFIYDRKTLSLSLLRSGFSEINEREIGESPYPHLRDIEDTKRLPPGFLALESMIFEARK